MRSTLGPSPGEVLADLGYADQAHFARDFKAMFGESPTHYAERY
ncbi:helix-turn-helix domain-containing protein [Spongiactinospora rosea]|nr:helix-turn-helix domain-containing protein [Spongiactinospora rosea]